MTEKKKPGRKPRKVEESTINATINSVHEAEARRQAREDVVAARALDVEARRHAREDAVEARRQAREDTLAERRLAHDLRRMEAAETMFSSFSTNVVGVARDGIHAMMPLYEHLGSEGTKEVILAQQESSKHAMDLLTTVLVEGVPAAIRAYAEVRSASKPAPVTHEDFATWTTTLMEHVYARNEAHLDLLDATTRNVSSSSGNRTQEAALSVLKDFLKHDDCDHADDDNDDDDDDGYLMGGFGGLKDDYTPPMPPMPRRAATGDFLSAHKSAARPPSASVDGKDVIVAVEDGVKVAFDSSFTDELELATGSASGAVTLSIYGEYDPGIRFGIKPLGTVRLDMHDDALSALADFIGCILPGGGDATFRVEVESGDTMLLVRTFSVKVISE